MATWRSQADRNNVAYLRQLKAVGPLDDKWVAARFAHLQKPAYQQWWGSFRDTGSFRSWVVEQEVSEFDGHPMRVDRVVGGGGDFGAWGQFSYRPETVTWLFDKLRAAESDEDLFALLDASSMSVAHGFRSGAGDVFEVHDDGQHRIAFVKAVGLPTVEMDVRQIYRTAQELVLPAHTPSDVRIPQLALWRSLIARGLITGRVTEGSNGYVLTLNRGNQLPWLALRPYHSYDLARAYSLADATWVRNTGLPQQKLIGNFRSWGTALGLNADEIAMAGKARTLELDRYAPRPRRADGMRQPPEAPAATTADHAWTLSPRRAHRPAAPGLICRALLVPGRRGGRWVTCRPTR